MKRTIILLSVAALAAACSKEMPHIQEGQAISLCAGISATAGMTRTAAATAVAYTNTVPTQDAPLDADVWFSTASGDYPGTGGVVIDNHSFDINSIDYHGTISYMNGSYTFPAEYESGKLLQYPGNANDPDPASVYCVGFYPQGKWNAATDGLTATSVAGLVDGKTDVMYAPEISGTVKNKFSTQTFNHILTWIKVRIRANSSDAPITWGKIQRIVIKSKDQAVVTFSTGSIAFQNASGDASGDARADIVAYSNSSGMDIPTMSQEVGSVFVAPVYGTVADHAKLDFYVTTEEWTDKHVVVELMDNNTSYEIGNTAGELYVVTLSFNALNTIEASATLTPWEDESRELIGSKNN